MGARSGGRMAWLGILMLVGLTLGVIPCRGQTTEGAAQPVVASEVKAQEEARSPLRLGDIVEAAERQRQTLNKLVPAKASALVAQLSEQAVDIRADVGLLKSRLEAAEGRSISPSRLSSLGDGLVDAQKRLGRLLSQLSAHSAGMETALTRLSEDQARWEQALQTARDASAPASLVKLIRSTQANLERAKATLQERHAEVLRLQGEFSSDSRRIEGLKDQLDEQQANVRATIFQADSTPLWAVFSQSETLDRLMQDVSAFVVESRDANKTYLVKALPLLTGLLVLTVACIGFLLVTRKRHSASIAAEPKLSIAAALLSRPFSVGLLVCFAFVPVMLRGQPEGFTRLFNICMALPLLRLIPCATFGLLKRVSYGTIVFFLIARLSYGLPEGAILSRSIHLLLALAMILGPVLAKRWRIEEAGKPIWWLNPALKLSFLAGAVALLANLFGHAILSTLLIQTYCRFLYAALSLHILFLATMELLRLVMLLGPPRNLASVRRHYAVIEAHFAKLLGVLIVVVWCLLALTIMDLRTPVLAGLAEVFSHQWHLGSVSLSLGGLVLFAAAILLSVVLSRILRFFLENDVFPRMHLSQGIPMTISMVLHYGLVSLGFLLACASAGIELSQISLIIGALGVGIGLGLQNVVTNFVSGIILIFERPLKVGDTIQFGDTTGTVRRIGLRSSTVQSFDGAEIIVPNTNLIASEVVNWTLSDRRRRFDLQVGVAYGTDPERVIALLNAVAARTPGVDADPAPWTSFDGFGDSSLNFTTRCWTAEYDNWVRVRTAFAIEVNKELAREHIEIPFPQRDLNLRSVSPEAAKVLGSEAGKVQGQGR